VAAVPLQGRPERRQERRGGDQGRADSSEGPRGEGGSAFEKPVALLTPTNQRLGTQKKGSMASEPLFGRTIRVRVRVGLILTLTLRENHDREIS